MTGRPRRPPALVTRKATGLVVVVLVVVLVVLVLVAAAPGGWPQQSGCRRLRVALTPKSSAAAVGDHGECSPSLETPAH